MDRQERIICAAIHYNDGKQYVHQPKNITEGFVVCGHRHYNCFMTVAILSNGNTLYQSVKDTQGFITNTNRFVDRNEGLEIALAANQVMDIDKIRGNRLYSEDLY